MTVRPLPHSPDLPAVAPRVIWFEEPEKALSDPVRFAVYVMTYGTPEDVAVLQRYLGEDEYSGRPWTTRLPASWTNAPGPIGT